MPPDRGSDDLAVGQQLHRPGVALEPLNHEKEPALVYREVPTREPLGWGMLQRFPDIKTQPKKVTLLLLSTPRAGTVEALHGFNHGGEFRDGSTNQSNVPVAVASRLPVDSAPGDLP